MNDITSFGAKRVALDEMKTREMQIAQEIDKMVRTGQLAIADEDQVQGCGARFFCGLFGNRPTAAVVEPRARTGMEARVFGQKGKKQTCASDRLSTAAVSVNAHAEQLGDRARAARTRARELLASSKKPEALAALKRAKALERQAETATATHAALEHQVDILAESDMQREVASALSASVASSKKRSKGLLSKTEGAVDGATELKEFAEEVAQTLGGLQTDVFDDDDLMEELQAMVSEDKIQTPVVVGMAASQPETVDVASYPRVPSKLTSKMTERRKLLEHDCADVSNEVQVLVS